MTKLYAISGSQLVPAPRIRLEKEDDLQRWIADDPSLIGLDVLVLGREITTVSGRIDVLAMDRDGKLVVIECKRDRTPRDVIAQILDYASWVNSLSDLQLDEIVLSKTKRHVEELFQARFGIPAPEKLNDGHSLVIVSGEFDSSSRRIVEYLAEVHGVAINTVFFSVFSHQGQTLIATDWLMDQDEVAKRAETKVKVPWSGLWYFNVGQGPHRSWEDMRKFGFVAAGHGRVYSDQLRKLKPGDALVAYQKGQGYVGYGIVSSPVVPANEFSIDETPVLSMSLEQPGLALDSDNPDLSEYLVGVTWEKTFPLTEAKTFSGIFTNQNIVCKLRDQQTLDFLRREFSIKTETAS